MSRSKLVGRFGALVVGALVGALLCLVAVPWWLGVYHLLCC